FRGPAPMIEAVVQALPFLGGGVLGTLQISAIVVVLWLGLGALLGLAIVFAPRAVALPIRLFSDVARCVPILGLIFFVFYVLPAVGSNLPNFAAAAVGLTVFKTAQTIETTRGALQAIHHGQIEAAKAIGLTFAKRVAWVLLPQAMRRFLPP